MGASELQEREVRVQRALRKKTLFVFSILFAISCATIPEPKHEKYSFPKGKAFIGSPPADRKYETLGVVRARADFSSMEFGDHDGDLCRNYFNKAVQDLLKFAHDAGGNAVIDVKSVVLLLDGKTEMYPRPECSDEGAEGQVLVRGIAIRWKPDPMKALSEPLTP